ncbi:E3 ubiquitin-protein ligase znrf2-like isoform X1 [Epinephelus moara]|uniref:E3 ubiquitin-protein ligase znrf2-like isoform X1 n=1 Tax=Epinephelus moara TaxID=300413 RepID=UPI00214F092B|nr:E3 ubiquitin-protein ligase znrf2-like isoform X1 [Epinephelus moara]
MGAKQSSPGFDGRTRAYSSSDLPSGNTSGGVRVAGFRYTNGPDGPRIRYTGGRPTSSGLSIPAGSHVLNQSLDGTDGDEESELPPEGHRLLIGSLPAHLSPHLLGGAIFFFIISRGKTVIFQVFILSNCPQCFHCPLCSKFMASDEIEKHLLMCFSKTRLTYNKDILSRDSGECAICLEELEQGDTIARLPCLCIYHKGCIDEWFEVNRSCPEHPAN